MKAANLLISNDGSLRIADFGLARSYNKNVAKGQTGDGSQRGRERKYTNCVVTRWYRPPELLMGARHYGGEVDIWGIGYACFFFLIRFLVLLIPNAVQMRFGRDVYPQANSSRHFRFRSGRKDLFSLRGPKSAQLAKLRPPTWV